MLGVRTPSEIFKLYQGLQRKHGHRDSRWADVKCVRDGQLEMVYPDLASEAWPRSVIANFVNTAARDIAELMAPLPAFNCTAPNMSSETARKYSDKKTKIINHYVHSSRLARQELTACDQYNTYGMKVYYIMPDFDKKSPRIVCENPFGGYPEFDKFDRLKSYTLKLVKPARDLALEYPNLATRIMRNGRNGDDLVEIIRYCDDKQITMIWCDEQPAVLSTMQHGLGRIPMAVAMRPGLDDEVHGQWDDVIWVQIARDYLAKLNIEATEKAIRAPLALPNDVGDVAYGPDATIRSNSPEKIRRIGVDVPQTAFAENQLLAKELRDGSRYPEGREGQIDASVITGRGVQALMGTIDTQIKAAQAVFADTFREVVEICMVMDEKYWGGTQKTINGQASGAPYQINYVPNRDIDGDYEVDVSYGLMAGLDPNRWLVFALQAHGANLISRDTLMRHLPMDMDVSAEEARINVEDTRKAIMQAVFGYAQAISVVAQTGGDPAMVVAKITQFANDLQKGKTVEQAASRAFPPPPPPEPASAGAGGAGPSMGVPGLEPGMAGDVPGGGPAGGVPQGLNANGLLQGVAAAGQPAGGRPDLQVMLAGLSGSGQPSLSSRVETRRPV